MSIAGKRTRPTGGNGGLLSRSGPTINGVFEITRQGTTILTAERHAPRAGVDQRRHTHPARSGYPDRHVQDREDRHLRRRGDGYRSHVRNRRGRSLSVGGLTPRFTQPPWGPSVCGRDEEGVSWQTGFAWDSSEPTSVRPGP